MDIVTVVVVTILVYSAIATLVIELSGEHSYVIAAFGFGPVGLLLVFLNNIWCKIVDLLKYRITKRAIIEDVYTGKRYKCKTQDVYNFSWYQEYNLVKRYAKRKEYKNIPNVPLDIMERVRVNCENCKYYDSCEYEVRCKSDSDGYRTEFDKFVADK